MVKPGLAVSIRYARASAISAGVRAGVGQAGSLPVDGFGWYTTVSLAAHGGADGVAAASASGADESERATSDGSGIMKSASSAGASVGVQFDMVASSRLMRFPCLMS